MIEAPSMAFLFFNRRVYCGLRIIFSGRVLDDCQPLVLALYGYPCGLGWSLTFKALVRPDVVVEYLVALDKFVAFRNPSSITPLTVSMVMDLSYSSGLGMGCFNKGVFRMWFGAWRK